MQRIATVVSERMSVLPVNNRACSISDFQRLHLTSFSGTKNLLGAEEWLIDMENLLDVVHISSENWIDVMKT